MLLRIRAERLARRLSIEMVSALTGISTAELSYVERGRMAVSDSTRETLSAFYNLPADVLFARVEKAS